MPEAPIPILDLKAEVESIWDELNDAIQTVLLSGQFIMGQAVKDFEESVARYLNVRYAIAVNSGTDALIIALRAAGIGPDAEVITSPFTFFATAEAILHLGAMPVFVDIDPDTYNLNVSQIEDQITDKTRALLPVHLYGQMADMDALIQLAHKHDLFILEDAAQAFGARWNGQMAGTIGDVGAYSFFPTKNLGAYGDAGLITTDRDDLAEQIRMLRVHGAKVKYYNEILGYNSRLDTLQAAILNVKLPYIDLWNEDRRRVAATYSELLKDVPSVKAPFVTNNSDHVFHQYTIRVNGDQRNNVKTGLAEQHIQTMIYYPLPVHKLPYYREQHIVLPEAELAAREVLSLPIWPGITLEQQSRVVRAIKNALR